MDQNRRNHVAEAIKLRVHAVIGPAAVTYYSATKDDKRIGPLYETHFAAALCVTKIGRELEDVYSKKVNWPDPKRDYKGPVTEIRPMKKVIKV